MNAKVKKFVVDKNRYLKAQKIQEVIKDYNKKELEGLRILDIGTGNGEIADFFSNKNQVYSVDVIDQRKNKNEKIIFKIVQSEVLPFNNNFFDIIISNHTIEHLPCSTKHLAEVHRVLNSEGIIYLATPNRLFPWETHYNMFLLHYFPLSFFHLILKFFKKYKEDIYLLSYFQLKKLIKYSNFQFKEYTPYILKYPDKYFFNLKFMRFFPLNLLDKLNFISQTNIFILKKR